jgi:hypothetical protein
MIKSYENHMGESDLDESVFSPTLILMRKNIFDLSVTDKFLYENDSYLPNITIQH